MLNGWSFSKLLTILTGDFKLYYSPKIQREYKKNTRRIQPKYKKNTSRIQGEYKQNTRRIQGEYN